MGANCTHRKPPRGFLLLVRVASSHSLPLRGRGRRFAAGGRYQEVNALPFRGGGMSHKIRENMGFAPNRKHAFLLRTYTALASMCSGSDHE